jgi:RNA-binding protein PNO1
MEAAAFQEVTGRLVSLSDARRAFEISSYFALLLESFLISLDCGCFIRTCTLYPQVRFNTKTRSVEMKTSPHTIDTGALQKGADFVSAFMLGFEVQDAVALLRLDDLYVESFQVTDVKILRGDHLSRAIGRVAGQDGKTRFAIENATRTRIVVADQRVHLLGSFANLRVARNAICDLILGAPPGKVYNNMRNVAKRMLERY